MCSYRNLFPSICNGLIYNTVKKLKQGSEIAQWIKIPVAMPGSLSLILRTHTVVGQKCFLQVVL